jgi:hypothetical protein
MVCIRVKARSGFGVSVMNVRVLRVSNRICILNMIGEF